ncbi:MAG: DUF3857 domain-containing protein [Acidobacteriaceae bacterium]
MRLSNFCRTARLCAFCGLTLLAVSQVCSAFAGPQARSVSSKPPSTPAANSPAAKSPPSTYAKEAYVVNQYDTQYTFHADGTGEQIVTVAVRVQSQAGIQQFGNIAVGYVADSQKVQLSYVRVRKSNGTIVEAPLTNMQDTVAPVTLQAPMYSSLRIKLLPVSNLNPGDTLEYQIHLIRNRAEAPNQFWLAHNFITTGVVLEESVQLRVPRQKHVQVVSAKIQPLVRQEGDETIYEWKTARLQEEPTSQAPVSPADTKPAIQATTFDNWQQVGEWYRGLESSRVVVTPAIQLQEQQLTKGLVTAEAKQQAIYAYVSTQFRYIGLSFGIGRYQPHMANEVLDNKFGDCKDKHTLFAALMKAAGYEVWPALISSGKKVDALVPYPGQFDHLISVLPKGNTVVWLDTTEEVAPFGMLASVLRDKQALVMPSHAAPELKRTPINPPFPESDIFTMKATLDSKAVLTGHANLTTRGDLELGLRAAFHITPEADWTKLAQNLAYVIGFTGEVSQFQADNPDDIAKPFHIDYEYTKKDYGGNDGKQISPPMPPIQFLLGTNDKKPEKPFALGAPGERDYRATVSLPRGEIATLSQDADIKTDFAEYRETSSVQDGTLLTERYLKLKQPELQPADWDKYLKFVKAVQDRENLTIPITIGNDSAEASAVRYSQAASELVQQAYDDIQQHRLQDGEALLHQAEAINPTQWGLAATYGDLYVAEKDIKRGLESYQKEVSLHPDNFLTTRYFSAWLVYQHRDDEAIRLWRNFLQSTPADPSGSIALGNILLRRKDYSGTIAALQRVAEANPSNADLHMMLGRAELRSGEQAAGASELIKALHSAQQPDAVNNAAYELADHDLDLTEASTYARAAMQKEEEEIAKTTLQDFTVNDLRMVVSLGAVWDTVAWIDFKQGKYAEAERYDRASWLLMQHPEVADHLGQIYAKEGKTAEAARIYRIAMAAGHLENAAETQVRFDALSSRSKPVEIPPYAVGAELSKLRTIEISGLPKQMISADFFVLLSSSGVEAVQFVKGAEALQSAVPILKKTHFEPSFPDSGPEKIVRRGVLSCSQFSATCQFVLLLPQWTQK